MKNVSLPRWLARLFAVLFYGQLICYSLFWGFVLYLSVSGLPNSGNLLIQANINGTVTAPVSMPGIEKDLEKWSKSTFDLKLNVPGAPSLQRADSALNLSLALNRPLDLTKLPVLLWLSGCSGLLLALLSVYVSYMFMKLFQSLADRHIFDVQQTTRLMYIGYSLFIYAGLSFIVKRLAERGGIIYLEKFGYTVSDYEVYNVGMGPPSVETISVITGLCILALTQVFKYGTQLQQENELTI